MSSIRALLSYVVDYAGLFPPAGLDMATAVQNYSAYGSLAETWMLGRFVVPVSRLDEFCTAADGCDRGWRLSAIVSDDIEGDVERIRVFNQGKTSLIDSVEVKADSSSGIDRIAAAVPLGVEVFVEIPHGDDPRTLVRALSGARLKAKIRTGGVTPDAFPTVEEVARFVRACYGAGVGFKATAGLHHPLRAEHPLTYDPDSPCGVMHGFLNVFLLAAFCYNGIGIADAPRLLEVTSVDAFAFGKDGVRWEEYEMSTAEIERVRRRFAASFGSCSFTEPVNDLKKLQLI